MAKMFALMWTTAPIKNIKYIFNNFPEDWFLQISPVLLEDDAIFQCQVGAADEVAPIRSENAQLTVYVPSDDPYIVQGNMIEVIEDEETWLECVSTGGKPAVDVSHYPLNSETFFFLKSYPIFRFIGKMEMDMSSKKV